MEIGLGLVRCSDRPFLSTVAAKIKAPFVVDTKTGRESVSRKGAIPNEAVTIVIPSETPLIIPAESTVATFGSGDIKRRPLGTVTCADVPFEYLTVAEIGVALGRARATTDPGFTLSPTGTTGIANAIGVAFPDEFNNSNEHLSVGIIVSDIENDPSEAAIADAVVPVVRLVTTANVPGDADPAAPVISAKVVVEKLMLTNSGEKDRFGLAVVKCETKDPSA
jgi:hypothetical protein